MNLVQSVCVATVLVVSSNSVAAAQDYDKGMAAARVGNWEVALQEFQPLAEQGNADASFNLGMMYQDGLGVSQDDAEAVKWYRLSLEQGYALALVNLGSVYRNSKGVLRDDVRAYMWYSIGASNEYGPAATFRDRVAERMTSVAIAEAQSMARECISSGYSDCGW